MLAINSRFRYTGPPVMVRRSLGSLALLAGVAFATSSLEGCLDDSSSVAAIASPALLTADPTTFRGTLRCGAPELAKYVVTLTDVSASPPTVLPSSLPVPCANIASFRAPPLAVSHFYTGAIDGYDRDDIRPEAAGSRTMLGDATNETVAPKWTTTCGELPPSVVQDGAAPSDAALPDADFDAFNPLRFPTQVLGATDVILRGCVALQAAEPSDASTDATAQQADAASDANGPEAEAIDGATPGPGGD